MFHDGQMLLSHDYYFEALGVFAFSHYGTPMSLSLLEKQLQKPEAEYAIQTASKSHHCCLKSHRQPTGALHHHRTNHVDEVHHHLQKHVRHHSQKYVQPPSVLPPIASIPSILALGGVTVMS